MKKPRNAYEEGYQAFYKDVDRMKNPYPDESQESIDWENGWDDAEFKVSKEYCEQI